MARTPSSALGLQFGVARCISRLLAGSRTLKSLPPVQRSASVSGSGRCTGKPGWRKLKGIAKVELFDGTICEAEIHWYEAHGIGKKEHKIKRTIE